MGELEFLDPELLEDEFEGNQFGKRLTFHPPDWKWTGMAFFEGEKLAMLEFSGELYANFEIDILKMQYFGPKNLHGTRA